MKNIAIAIFFMYSDITAHSVQMCLSGLLQQSCRRIFIIIIIFCTTTKFWFVGNIQGGEVIVADHDVMFYKGGSEVIMTDHDRTCVVFNKGESEVIMAARDRTCVVFYM